MRLTARRIRKNEISGYLVSDDLGEIAGWVADAYNCNVTAAERERVERTTFPTLREALKDLDVWFDGDPGAPPREYMPVCRLVSERSWEVLLAAVAITTTMWAIHRWWTKGQP